MPAHDLVEQVYILDRSGSMQDRVSDVLGGFNALLKQQKELPGRCNVTLVIFDAPGTDSGYKVLHDGCDVNNVAPLTKEVYFARGGTALRDAIGYAVSSVGSRLARTPEHERPRKVTVVVYSDGEENSSKEFSSARIKEMIEHQQGKYSWDFTFVGTNQDALLQAGNYGIGAHAAINFSSTPKGFAGGWHATTNYVSASRLAAPGEVVAYSMADRLDAAAGEDLPGVPKAGPVDVQTILSNQHNQDLDSKSGT